MWHSASIQLWNVATSELFHMFVGHTDNVTNIAILPNRQFAISGDSDGKILLWDLRDYPTHQTSAKS
jgi:WD40 repeat protein